jgi:hypothetical protein
MERVHGTLAVFVLLAATLWGQGQAQASNGTGGTAPQTAAPAAASNQNNISGCLQQSFGVFKVDDAATSKDWQIKGNGANLWSFENHVVRVQGLPDPKSATPVMYAQNVQDTGETCGTQAAASQSIAGKTGNNGVAQNVTTTSNATPTAANNQVGAPPNLGQAGQSNAAAANSASAAERNEVGAPQGTLGVGSNQPASTAATPSYQGGTAGATSPNPPQGASAEQKGVQAAGTIASNTAPQPANDALSVFTGCLIGSINNYQFKSNGKAYHLQGNTIQLSSMVNHQVELTGEDFNGKAIQVNGARDLGSTCKGK